MSYNLIISIEAEKQYRKAVLSQMNYSLIFKNVKKNVYIIGIFHDSQNYGEQL